MEYADPTKNHLNRKIITFRSAPKLMPCQVCGISTVHHQTQGGAWLCWCGNVDEEAIEAQGEDHDEQQ